MPRVKRGTNHVKKRRKLYQKAKGYKWGRKNLIRLARTAVTKAGAHSYAHRKQKKREMRRLWNIRINAFLGKHDLSYSKFMNLLKKENIELDRKILADLAANDPEIMEKLLTEISQDTASAQPQTTAEVTAE